MRIRSSSEDPSLGTNAEETWDDPGMTRIASANNLGDVEGTNNPEDPTMLSSGWSVVSESESEEETQGHRNSVDMEGVAVADDAPVAETQRGGVAEEPHDAATHPVMEVAVDAAMQQPGAVMEVAVGTFSQVGEDLSEIRSPSEVSRPERGPALLTEKDEDGGIGAPTVEATANVVPSQVVDREDPQMKESTRQVTAPDAKRGSVGKKAGFSVLHLILSCAATAAITIAACAVWDHTWRSTALKLEESLRYRESELAASEAARRAAEDEKDRLEENCVPKEALNWDKDLPYFRLDSCWIKARASLSLGDCADETVQTFRDTADNWWEWGKSWLEYPADMSRSSFATAGVTLSSLKRAGDVVANGIASSAQLFEHWQNDDLQENPDDTVDTSELSKLWERKGKPETEKL